MGHGKKESGKIGWKFEIKRKGPIDKKDVNRLIAAIQQELQWDDRDVRTSEAIEKGEIDWSGDVRRKRKS